MHEMYIYINTGVCILIYFQISMNVKVFIIALKFVTIRLGHLIVNAWMVIFYKLMKSSV